MKEAGSDLVVIKVYRIPWEAELAAVRLRTKGIEAVVQGSHYDTSDGPSFPATGVEVVVRRGQVRKAMEILE